MSVYSRNPGAYPGGGRPAVSGGVARTGVAALRGDRGPGGPGPRRPVRPACCEGLGKGPQPWGSRGGAKRGGEHSGNPTAGNRSASDASAKPPSDDLDAPDTPGQSSLGGFALSHLLLDPAPAAGKN